MIDVCMISACLNELTHRLWKYFFEVSRSHESISWFRDALGFYVFSINSILRLWCHRCVGILGITCLDRPLEQLFPHVLRQINNLYDVKKSAQSSSHTSRSRSWIHPPTYSLSRNNHWTQWKIIPRNIVDRFVTCLMILRRVVLEDVVSRTGETNCHDDSHRDLQSFLSDENDVDWHLTMISK